MEDGKLQWIAKVQIHQTEQIVENAPPGLGKYLTNPYDMVHMT